MNDPDDQLLLLPLSDAESAAPLKCFCGSALRGLWAPNVCADCVGSEHFACGHIDTTTWSPEAKARRAARLGIDAAQDAACCAHLAKLEAKAALPQQRQEQMPWASNPP